MEDDRVDEEFEDEDFEHEEFEDDTDEDGDDFVDENDLGSFPDPPVPDFDSAGRPVPPWVKYPNLRRGSIGWRMGGGELHLCRVFGPWWQELPDADRESYQADYPTPAEWEGWYGVPNRDSEGRFVPPWVKRPKRSRRSVLWRFPSGQRFLNRFWSWWDSLSVAAQEEYRCRYPEPEEWQGFLSERTIGARPQRKS